MLRKAKIFLLHNNIINITPPFLFLVSYIPTNPEIQRALDKTEVQRHSLKKKGKTEAKETAQ